MPSTILVSDGAANGTSAGSNPTDTNDAPRNEGDEPRPVVLSPEYEARIKVQAAIWAKGWAEKATREAEAKAKAEVLAEAKPEQDVTRAAIAEGESKLAIGG